MWQFNVSFPIFTHHAVLLAIGPFFGRAERIDLETFRRQPLSNELKHSVARLFAPVL